jgi:HTH-type transcriptional regulator/antitoxin HigA
MANRLIKNETDYNDVLSRIEQLMDANPDTDVMDELELLTVLVELYEEKHFPISPPDPIEAIKFRMDQLGLSQNDMIPYFGSKSRVSEVLNGKRTLTLAMMRSLNNGLGISAEVLLKESVANFPEEMQDINWLKFPIVEMAKRKWLPTVDDISGKAEELMRDFIRQAGGLETVPNALFYQGKRGRFNLNMDP